MFLKELLKFRPDRDEKNTSDKLLVKNIFRLFRGSTTPKE